jgi:hypothetical protein
MTDDELIQRGGWWKGTKREWQELTYQERQDIAFAATGCEVAYPSWEAPVECSHILCQIRRGEKPKIAFTEAVLNSERESGWLRFMPEKKFQRLRKAVLQAAEATGIYNPWEIPDGWKVMVFGGIME